MTRTSAIWAGLAVLVLVACGLLTLGVASERRPQREVPGAGELLFEDVFGFRVVTVRTTDAIGARRAQGRFWIVDLEITNHAQGVDYDTTGHRAILKVENGDRHAIDRSAQVAGGSPEPPTHLASGASCRQQLVFDVPSAIDRAELEIVWGGPIGELLMDIVFGDKRFELALDRDVKPASGDLPQ